MIIGRGRKYAQQRIDIVDMSVSEKHCTLTDNGDGSFTLEDLNSVNGTFVVRNGNLQRFMRAQVSLNDTIALGPNFRVNIKDLLQTPQIGYSIRPLEKVWDDYETEKENIMDRQDLFNNFRLFPMIGGIVSGYFLKNEEGGLQILPSIISGLFIVLSVVPAFYKSRKKIDQLTKQFQKDYHCPNPDCNHFLGMQSYELLSQNSHCPYCRCKLHK